MQTTNNEQPDQHLSFAQDTPAFSAPLQSNAQHRAETLFALEQTDTATAIQHQAFTSDSNRGFSADPSLALTLGSHEHFPRPLTPPSQSRAISKMGENGLATSSALVHVGSDTNNANLPTAGPPSGAIAVRHESRVNSDRTTSQRMGDDHHSQEQPSDTQRLHLADNAVRPIATDNGVGNATNGSAIEHGNGDVIEHGNSDEILEIHENDSGEDVVVDNEKKGKATEAITDGLQETAEERKRRLARERQRRRRKRLRGDSDTAKTNQSIPEAKRRGTNMRQSSATVRRDVIDVDRHGRGSGGVVSGRRLLGSGSMSLNVNATAATLSARHEMQAGEDDQRDTRDELRDVSHFEQGNSLELDETVENGRGVINEGRVGQLNNGGGKRVSNREVDDGSGNTIPEDAQQRKRRLARERQRRRRSRLREKKTGGDEGGGGDGNKNSGAGHLQDANAGSGLNGLADMERNEEGGGSAEGGQEDGYRSTSIGFSGIFVPGGGNGSGTANLNVANVSFEGGNGEGGMGNGPNGATGNRRAMTVWMHWSQAFDTENAARTAVDNAVCAFQGQLNDVSSDARTYVMEQVFLVMTNKSGLGGSMAAGSLAANAGMQV